MLAHQAPTLSDMLSVILRSTQSLGPVDWASANRSLVIAFMTRLVNWGLHPLASVRQKHRKDTCPAYKSSGVKYKWLRPSISLQKHHQCLTLFTWYLPDSSSRLSLLLCFSSFLLLFFAASCLSQLRCFLITFLCSIKPTKHGQQRRIAPDVQRFLWDTTRTDCYIHSANKKTISLR